MISPKSCTFVRCNIVAQNSSSITSYDSSKKRRMKQLINLLILITTMALTNNSFACKKQKTYSIDYDGRAEFYTTPDNKPAPTKASAGEQLTILLDMVATDTRYDFYLDDEQLNPNYITDHGYLIQFVMPEHDVKLRCLRQNISEEQLFSIDFSGQDYAYLSEPYDRNREPKPARKQYRAGEQVVLYYFMVATDTDYTFVVDGMAVQPDFERSTGFIIRFTMPDHDVTIRCIERNTMLPDDDNIIIVR